MLDKGKLERYKEFYRSGLWSDAMLDNLLSKKRITKTEYNEIKAARED